MPPRKKTDADSEPMALRKYHVRFDFTEDILGSTPDTQEVYETYVQAKVRTANVNGHYATNGRDELETLSVARDKTDFHRLGNTPILYEYVFKGFMKESCAHLRALGGKTLSSELTTYKTIINAGILIKPRRVPLRLAGGPTFDFSRILRTDTAQGPRNVPVCSVSAPANTWLEFEMHVMGNIITEALLTEWFDRGEWVGLGQWRSGGWGRFTYQLTSIA